MTPIKLAVLGATGSGKTSLVRQFVQNQFDERQSPTRCKEVYYPTVLIDQRLYQLQIVDLPPISYVPRNSFEEWSYCRGYGLLNAHAYLLVFDINSAQSFQHAKMLREQLCSARADTIIVVVGNKQDLLLAAQATSGTNMPLAHTHQQSNSHANDWRSSAGSDLNKELAQIVRKQWKCVYVECSAKFNWRVVAAFSALMKAVDPNDDWRLKRHGSSANSNNNNNASSDCNNHKCELL